MKIKNDLIAIKNGSKIYNYNNLILQEYLNKFAYQQNIYRVAHNSGKLLGFAFLKFDTPIENVEENSKIKVAQFDVYSFPVASFKQIISENQIIIDYNYKFELYQIEKYFKNKITAIGFCISSDKDNYIDAFLDTSNYNIYLEENQDLTISRRDIVTTDALFYTNNTTLIKGPVHLCPGGIPEIIPTKIYQNRAHARLYSVGLSSYIDYIDKEYIVGTDLGIQINNNEVSIKGLKNYLSTAAPIYASNVLYPSDILYPAGTNYKYIILKYIVYQEKYIDESILLTDDFDTDCFYYQAIPIDKFGKSNLTIKYERSQT